MSEDYRSSEELQRHNADVFANKAAEKKPAETTRKDKVNKLLDKYIKDYSKTSTVRKMAEEAGRTADAQLDLSADIVEILEKIKSELR